MKSMKINKEDPLVCSKWKRLSGTMRKIAMTVVVHMTHHSFVPAHLGCPGKRAVKLLLLLPYCCVFQQSKQTLTTCPLNRRLFKNIFYRNFTTFCPASITDMCQ